MTTLRPALLALLVPLACGRSPDILTDSAGESDSSGDSSSSDASSPTTTPEPTTAPVSSTGTESATTDLSTDPSTTTTGDTTAPIDPDTTTSSESEGTRGDSSTSSTGDTGTDDTSTSTSESSDTSQGEAGLPPDTTPPELSLVRPHDGIFVTSRRIEVRGAASDDLEVTALELSLNGAPAVPIDITPGAAVAFATSDFRLARGLNTLKFTARDAADNSASQEINIHLGVPVTAGGAHSLAIVDDATWGFGRNNEGQLGLGNLTDQLIAVKLPTLPTPVTLSANLNHTLAVAADGTVLAWGRNDEAQIGLGVGADVQVPTAVPGVPESLLVAAGQRHSLALTVDGHVWSWGSNSDGQLGRDGDNSKPAVVPDIDDIVAIAAGGSYSLAVDGGGVVWAWGNNDDGQLGDGSTSASPLAKSVLDEQTVAVAAGKAHSLALAAPGMQSAWGLNASGQIGDGTVEDRVSPIAIPEFADTVSVAASGNLSLGLASDGALWAWGQNFNGQLGLGDSGSGTDRTAATAVPGLPPIRAIAAGLAHTVVFDADGAVWAWGLNSFGQLGKGDKGAATSSSVPLKVTF